MKAILLSAGYGKRLGPLTEDLPKVMIPLNGKPCLEYNIENLKNQGVNSFLINTHYFPEKILNYYGNGSQYGVNITYSYESEILGTSGALNGFREELQETFLVVYGDVISNIDVNTVSDVHKRNNSLATIVLDAKRNPQGKGIVLHDGEKVIDFVEKPIEKIEGGLINSGFYMLEPQILNNIPEGFSDFGKDILPDIVKKRQVYCVEHQGYIFDIGTKQDLENAERFLKSIH